MLGLPGFVESLNKRGDTLDVGKLNSEYEPTRAAVGHPDKRVVFRLRDWVCVTNIYRSRKDLYELLGASNDRELYGKISRAIKNPAPLEAVSFWDYYERAPYSMNDLPFIKFYREDGGPYLTGSIFIGCLEDKCNSSFHRVMYVSGDRAVLRIVPRHLHYIVKRHHEAGRDAPAAMVLGADPWQEIAAASSPPFGVFEVAVGASLSGLNKIAKTPLYGLPIPLGSSVVVEGVISRDEEWEGPFVDILGLVDERRKQPVFVPHAFYRLRGAEPTYHAIVPATADHVHLMGLPKEPQIYEAVSSVSPGLKAVRLAPWGAGWLAAVLSVDRLGRGEAINAALAAIAAHPSLKMVVVVDSDIDVDDPSSVLWAIVTRSKPSEDIIVLKGAKGSTLDPRSPDGLGDKLIIVAAKPPEEPWSKYRRVAPP